MSSFGTSPVKALRIVDLNSEPDIPSMSAEAARCAATTPLAVSYKGVVFAVHEKASPKEVFKLYKKREFDIWADHYDHLFVSMNHGFYSLLARTLQRLAVTSPGSLARIADIGCGDGFIARALYADPARFAQNPDPLKLRYIPAFPSGGAYLGIDPSEQSLMSLNRWFDSHGQAEERSANVAYRLIPESASTLLDEPFRRTATEMIGGPATLVTMGAALHVIAKSLRADNRTPQELLAALYDMTAPRGLLVVGNYYHLEGDRDGQENSAETAADFAAFKPAYIKAFGEAWERLTGQRPVTHEPTPPPQLFPPATMREMLEAAGFTFLDCARCLSNPSLCEKDGRPGLRGYVMIARRDS